MLLRDVVWPLWTKYQQQNNTTGKWASDNLFPPITLSHMNIRSEGELHARSLSFSPLLSMFSWPNHLSWCFWEWRKQLGQPRPRQQNAMLEPKDADHPNPARKLIRKDDFKWSSKSWPCCLKKNNCCMGLPSISQMKYKLKMSWENPV